MNSFVSLIFDITTDYKVTELFCVIDEFCKHFDAENAGNLLEDAGSYIEKAKEEDYSEESVNDYRDTWGNIWAD